MRINFMRRSGGAGVGVGSFVPHLENSNTPTRKFLNPRVNFPLQNSYVFKLHYYLIKLPKICTPANSNNRRTPTPPPRPWKNFLDPCMIFISICMTALYTSFSNEINIIYNYPSSFFFFLHKSPVLLYTFKNA